MCENTLKAILVCVKRDYVRGEFVVEVAVGFVQEDEKQIESRQKWTAKSTKKHVVVGK